MGAKCRIGGLVRSTAAPDVDALAVLRVNGYSLQIIASQVHVVNWQTILDGLPTQATICALIDPMSIVIAPEVGTGMHNVRISCR